MSKLSADLNEELRFWKEAYQELEGCLVCAAIADRDEVIESAFEIMRRVEEMQSGEQGDLN